MPAPSKSWIPMSLLIFAFGCSQVVTPTRQNQTTKDNSVVKVGQLSIELVYFAPTNEAGILRGFHITRFEVTNAQYKEFIAETGYDGSDHPTSKEPFLGHFRNGDFPKGHGDYPVSHLNWYHAQAYCRWVSRKIGRSCRLPSKEEWEFVAGGTEHRVYPWGNEWDPMRCNWAGKIDGYEGVAPVGVFPLGATPEGVHDLAGNIWEWCEDKALRGGPWCLNKESMKSSFFSFEQTDRADDKFGFRFVLLDDNT